MLIAHLLRETVRRMLPAASNALLIVVQRETEDKKGKEGAHGGHGVAEAKAKDARFVGDECKTPFRLFLHAVNCPVIGPDNLI